MSRLRALAPLGALLLALLLAACGGDGAPAAAPASLAASTASRAPERVTFMAGFTPQANLPFVGVYVAVAKGYFAEQGLEVEVRHSSGQDEHLKLLLAQGIDFTTGTAAQVLRRRADVVPVVAVALFGQRGDQGYVARADSGIKGPADFRGRSVGFKAGVVPAELKAMLASAGLAESDVKLQAVGFDPRVFIEKQVDVYPVFLNNEPDTIRRVGVPITVIDPADFGVLTLGLTFLAHEDTVKQRPQTVERFLRASLRGVQYASEHVDEAVQITLQYAKGADAEHQKFLLETEIAGAKRAGGVGRSDAAQWQSLEQLLRKFGVLEAGKSVAGAYDGSFVDRLYDAQGKLK
ncbi:MAG: hypothetical protein EXR65_00385 [Dehalococcoidia bacterium]|nr:hypothetical protein [Dehalococcoidia bacterium]